RTSQRCAEQLSSEPFAKTSVPSAVKISSEKTFLSRPRLRYAINRGRPRYSLHRILFQQPHSFLHCALELRIVPFNYLRRRVLDFDIRRHSCVLDGPLSGQIVKGQIWCRDSSTINRRWKTKRADKSSPCARADQRSQLSLTEHVGQRVAA